jgi:N-acetylglutamate synthase/N-acetylornithine aminotransferase
MQLIIDKRNVTFNGISIDGIFNSNNLIAFTAGTKNNPDILSQAQMLKALHVDLFLASQQLEI